MKTRTASVAAGLGYLLAVAVFAVLAGIGPVVVADPALRVPALLFAALVPGAAAFLLGAGGVYAWRRYDLRTPALGLVLGSVAGAFVADTEALGYALLLGGFGWLTLLGVVELLGRAVATRRRGGSLPADERAALLGSFVGLAYAVVFGALAVRPAWTGATGTSAPGFAEAVLTLAFLAGAFCLLLGLPVALLASRGLVSPLAVPALWVGYDAVTGWGAYAADEFATVAFVLVWPATLVVVVALAVLESLLRRGWRRLHRKGGPATRADDSTA